MEAETWEEEEEERGVQGESRFLAAQGEERRREEVITSRAIV